MKQKKMILTSKDVKIMFETNLIDIQHIAINSKNADDFKKQLLEGLDLKGDVPLSPEKENLKRLIMHDGMTIKEASTEQGNEIGNNHIFYGIFSLIKGNI
jgi:hypothetical protein